MTCCGFLRVRLAVLLQCVFCLVGCGLLSNTDPQPIDIAKSRNARGDDLQSAADELLRPFVDRADTPGIVAGVLLPDGRVRFFGYGVTAQNGGVIPDGDTLFAIGSLSKGFLAGALAVLADEGIIKWNDTISGLAPSATKLSSDAKKITLLQLATHTSGMPRQPFDLRTMALFVRYLFTGESFYEHLSRDYVMDYLATFRSDHRSGLQYSNIAYGVLGHMLSLRTGQSAEALVEQRVIRPLGLRCTGYAPEQLPCYATRALGYAGDQPRFIGRGNPTPDWQFNDLMRASAGLYSTARDLLTMASAHLNNGGYPIHSALAGNVRGRSLSASEVAGVAWTIKELDGRMIAYQVGFVAGYSSYIGLDIWNRTAVVILQNSFNWDLRVGHLLLLRAGDW